MAAACSSMRSTHESGGLARLCRAEEVWLRTFSARSAPHTEEVLASCLLFALSPTLTERQAILTSMPSIVVRAVFLQIGVVATFSL